MVRQAHHDLSLPTSFLNFKGQFYILEVILKKSHENKPIMKKAILILALLGRFLGRKKIKNLD